MTDFDPGIIEQWDPATRAEIAARLAAYEQEPPRVWFCHRGRDCDGMPHDNIPYSHARSDQWPPIGDWFVWAILSGRGAGKTRTGTEFTRKSSAHYGRMGIIGRRVSDIRQTLVEGESGLIRICEAAKISYEWMPSKREFTFQNGAKAFFYSGEEPDSLRGPEHDFIWADEPAHMPAIQEVWDNAMLGLRLGKRPKALVTSTPIPVEWLIELLARDDTRLVRVSTYANLHNLAPSFRQTVINRYEGTRLGRQELHGEILEDVEGALWDGDLIDACYGDIPHMDDLDRIVVGVDPAGTANKKSDETGIVVVGKKGDNYYVLADYTGKYTPDEWGKKAIRAYNTWHADRIIVETNYGGDMTKANLRNQEQEVPVKGVHSRKGKDIRAEPIVGLYEQGRVKHPKGMLSDLEKEQLRWIPHVTPSPNRIDAMVHAMTELMGKGQAAAVASAVGTPLPRVPINQPRGRIYTPGM